MFRESFVDETTSKSVVSKTFITVSIVILAMIFTLLFIWSYQKSYKLFIMIFSIIIFIFALLTVIFVTLTRSKLSELQFRIYLSVTVFMTLMSLIMIIFFTILAVGHLKKINELTPQATASYSAPQYQQQYAPAPQMDMYNQQTPYGSPVRQSLL
jgi:quinol-cytochrome oxidoreductase complex cytochrome b subunit